MSTVVLAEDTLLGRRVALKRMHASEDVRRGSRLRREALIGASVSHPNLVPIYDIVTAEDGESVIVMEYVEGETLRDAVRRDGPLPTPKVLKVLGGVAAALDAIHAQGIVHRDVKPANILLGSDGTTKLADLGVASSPDRTRITTEGGVVGTFSYMAPEQLGGVTATHAVDVYALAAVAFEALSGRKARIEPHPLALAHAIANSPPPDLREAWPQAPADAAKLLVRGMSRNPNDRPRSAGELVGRLREALAPETTAGLSAPERRVRRALAPAAGAGVAGAAAAGAGAASARAADARPASARPASARATGAGAAGAGAASAAGAGARPRGTGTSAGASAPARRPARARPQQSAQKPAPPRRTPSPAAKPRPAAPESAGAPHRNRRKVLAAALIPAVILAAAIAAIVVAATDSSSSHRTGTTQSRSTPTTASRRSTSARTTGSGTRSTTASSTPGASSPGVPSSAASSGGGPVSAVERFYTLAAGHDYAAAWALADPAFQSQLGGYQGFQNTMAADRSITFDTAHTVSQSAGGATVQVQTTSVRSEGTQHCAGTVQVVPGAGGSWLLHQIGISCS